MVEIVVPTEISADEEKSPARNFHIQRSIMKTPTPTLSPRINAVLLAREGGHVEYGVLEDSSGIPHTLDVIESQKRRGVWPPVGCSAGECLAWHGPTIRTRVLK